MDFKLDDHGFSWVATAKFASWSGYLDRSGSYGGKGDGDQSDGSVEIVFAPEGRDSSPLSDHEMSLVQWLLDHEPRVSAAVKAAIIQNYPSLQESCDLSAEELAQYMPDLASPEDLQRLIGLYAINVHQIDKDGLPYLGFEFGCTWDDEHGAGVLMHGTRFIDIGGSDTARLLWIAEQDADAAG